MMTTVPSASPDFILSLLFVFLNQVLLLLRRRRAQAALTIAVRYGLVRRQGEDDDIVMGYQSHQVGLMPLLATTYGLHFVVGVLRARYNDAIGLVHTGTSRVNKSGE